MMTLTDKVTVHMQALAAQGEDISKLSNVRILLSYYSTLGLTTTTTMVDWLQDDKYPMYSSVTRAIRLARERNSMWKKEAKQKAQEVTDVKEEVGRE